MQSAQTQPPVLCGHVIYISSLQKLLDFGALSLAFSGNGRIQAQPSGSYLMNNYVMNSAITRIGLADNLLPWRKYFTYFYPRFLPLSQLIIPYRTFSRTLLRRKLGERCLNVLVHLNENRGFNFSIFWGGEKKKSLFLL